MLQKLLFYTASYKKSLFKRYGHALVVTILKMRFQGDNMSKGGRDSKNRRQRTDDCRKTAYN